MTCEQCRERPAEAVLVYAERCRLTEKPICRECAKSPQVRGPHTVRPLTDPTANPPALD